MVDDVARLVLAVAAPLLLSPLVACLLLDALAGGRHRRQQRTRSLLGAGSSVAALALLVAALLLGGRALAGVAGAVAAAAVWVGAVFLTVLAHPWTAARRRADELADVVVVLGTKLGPGGRVPPLLAHRLERAVALWRAVDGPARGVPLVVTGAAVPGSHTSEAAAMARHLVAQGVPSGCVLVEDHATTTEENLRLGSRLASERATASGSAAPRVAVVTNTFHTFRTARTAARLHLRCRVRAAPTPWDLLPAASVRELSILLGERLPVHVLVGAVLAALAVLATTWSG
ncbi:MAG TPA: YdcF family protein [Segeticoccus sp.]|nr:YdcF family protein [Segeticoccus sp.]